MKELSARVAEVWDWMLTREHAADDAGKNADDI